MSLSPSLPLHWLASILPSSGCFSSSHASLGIGDVVSLLELWLLLSRALWFFSAKGMCLSAWYDFGFLHGSLHWCLITLICVREIALFHIDIFLCFSDLYLFWSRYSMSGQRIEIMTGRRKRGGKKQNNNNKEKSTREEDVPSNVSLVVEEHVEELSDENYSDGVYNISDFKNTEFTKTCKIHGRCYVNNMVEIMKKPKLKPELE
ncbi:hypothetical protein F2Q70_00021749 [Brassica cretica]|uniref:Uncharacterized protein n=1 Tax=Brassica cretica TaxID=69181 RepID=A0A8S9GU32_BRACR|nr:hypothetical protein F2Q70_00021749 [Brassica cretica]